MDPIYESYKNSIENKWCLIVEDNKFSQTLLKKLLIKGGIPPNQIVIVGKAKNALGIINHINFDIIFIDGTLDGMNSNELVRRTKNIAYIVVISSTAGFDDYTINKDSAINAGADEVLSKPAHSKDIYRIIKK